jgi:hypothetical protein
MTIASACSWLYGLVVKGSGPLRYTINAATTPQHGVPEQVAVRRSARGNPIW